MGNKCFSTLCNKDKHFNLLPLHTSLTYLNAATFWIMFVWLPLFSKHNIHVNVFYIQPCVSATQTHLDGLSKAAFPQHLSMDEVRWAEDAVRLIGHDAQRLWSINVLPLGDGGCCVAGAGWLINAAAPPGGRGQEEKEGNRVEYLITDCCYFYSYLV